MCVVVAVVAEYCCCCDVDPIDDDDDSTTRCPSVGGSYCRRHHAHVESLSSSLCHWCSFSLTESSYVAVDNTRTNVHDGCCCYYSSAATMMRRPLAARAPRTTAASTALPPAQRPLRRRRAPSSSSSHLTRSGKGNARGPHPLPVGLNSRLFAMPVPAQPAQPMRPRPPHAPQRWQPTARLPGRRLRSAPGISSRRGAALVAGSSLAESRPPPVRPRPEQRVQSLNPVPRQSTWRIG